MTHQLIDSTDTNSVPRSYEPAPEARLASLLERLKSDDAIGRKVAAQDLKEYGAQAVQPLCEALKDKEDEVREAAAQSLLVVGDDTAVGPLVEALRAGFPGRSPRRQRVMTMLFYILIPFALIAALMMIIATKGEGLGDLLSTLHYIESPSQKLTGDRLAYIHALAAIAERSPTPELRKVLSDLRDIEADTLQQDVKTRAASRAAARKIEKLTAKLDQLPVMAAAPSPDTTQLPVIGSEAG